MANWCKDGIVKTLRKRGQRCDVGVLAKIGAKLPTCQHPIKHNDQQQIITPQRCASANLAVTPVGLHNPTLAINVHKAISHAQHSNRGIGIVDIGTVPNRDDTGVARPDRPMLACSRQGHPLTRPLLNCLGGRRREPGATGVPAVCATRTLGGSLPGGQSCLRLRHSWTAKQANEQVEAEGSR
jgi:hypothetical protein